MTDTVIQSPRAVAPALPAATPVVLLLIAAIFLNYIDRGVIAVAAPLMKSELGLSATMFGVAVSAFFWTYVPAQLFLGAVVDRRSVYRLFGQGVGLWGLATAAIGAVTALPGLIAARVALGLGESVAFPGAAKLITRHVPARRRGAANAGVGIAMALGPAFGTFAGGLMLVAYGWRSLFLVFGLSTLVWLLPWWRLTRHAPHAVEPSALAGGFFALLRRRAMWASAIGQFGSNYGLYFMLSWLPLYLVKSRGFSVGAMAELAGLVYLVQALGSLAAGLVTDHLIARGAAEAPVRKLTMVAGQFALAAGVLGAVQSTTPAALAPWLFLASAAVGASQTGLGAAAQIFAGPAMAGRWYGMQNGLGNIAGITGPIITGLIVDISGSYTGAFAVASAVAAVSALCWAFVVPRIEPVPWPAFLLPPAGPK